MYLITNTSYKIKMHKYRISKYSPEHRDSQGRYLKNEWTSYSDIGKMYDGEVFEIEHYLAVENRFCEAIISILKNEGITEMVIKNLECNYTIDEIREMFEESGLNLSKGDEYLINSLSNDQRVELRDLSQYIKLILRESFWCKFENVTAHKYVEFGFDYYAYIYCDCISEEVIYKYGHEGIFIEKLDN